MLHEFVAANRDAIIARTEATVKIGTRPSPSTSELVDGTTVFLSQLFGNRPTGNNRHAVLLDRDRRAGERMTATGVAAVVKLPRSTLSGCVWSHQRVDASMSSSGHRFGRPC